MTDFTNIPLANLEPGDPITDEILQAIYLNLLAFAEGSLTGDGAPRLAEQALDHSPVNRQALKTLTNSAAYNFGSGGGSANINLNPYSFFPAHDGNASAALISASAGNADSPRLVISSGTTSAGTVYWRYIAA